MSQPVEAVCRRAFTQSVFHPACSSPSSRQAFAHALALALVDRARLELVPCGPAGKVARAQLPSIRATLEGWGLLRPGRHRNAIFEEFGVRIRKRRSSISSLRRGLDLIRESDCDLIVVGTEGKGRWSGRLGPSKALGLIRRARRMGLLVPKGCRGFVSSETGGLSLRRVLVPIDGAIDANRGLVYATVLAELLGDPPVMIELLHVGSEPLPSLKKPDGASWVWRETRRGGNVVDEILRASEAADLVVMSTSLRRGLRDLCRPGITERVLRRVDCPVLVMPGSG